MQPVAPGEPTRIELVGPQLRRDTAVGRHRAIAVSADERDDYACLALDERPGELDATPVEERPDQRTGLVVRLLADEAGRLAELRDPRRDVGRLAARGDARLRRRVGPGRKHARRSHDHVQEQISESANQGAACGAVLRMTRLCLGIRLK